MSAFWFRFGSSAVENRVGAYLLTAALHRGGGGLGVFWSHF